MTRVEPGVGIIGAKDWTEMGQCPPSALITFRFFATSLSHKVRREAPIAITPRLVSPSPEIRRPLLVKGQHALAAVLGRDHAVVSLDLERKPVPQRQLQSAMD